MSQALQVVPMRCFPWTGGFVVSCFALVVASSLARADDRASADAANGPSRAPNVLLILTDDQGYGDVRSHDNPLIETPMHDRLADEGARFDRFFVSPVCAPTRAALLTGRYHPRTGVWGVTRTAETMRAEEVTLAECLRDAGYATGCFGKWHNGAHFPHDARGQGFDQFVGFNGGHWNNYHDARLIKNGQWIESEGFIIDVFTDHAIEFIEANHDRPWFAYLPYNTPHTPWQVPDRYWEKYTADPRITDRATACAYAMVENIDDNIGRLLAVLDKHKLADDTIVIFLSDNGANSDRYNAGMKGRKGSLDEGGTRVPCFLRYPAAVKAGQVIQPIAAHIDLLPTILDLADVEDPRQRDRDGRSLVPLLKGQADGWPARTLMTHWGGQLSGEDPDRVAARTDRWRLVRLNKQWRLYDMQADPGQQHDVSEAHPELLADLKQQLRAWAADVTQAGFQSIPSELGHPEAPVVTLPGHEAFLQPRQGEGIDYMGRSGWANDFVTKWTSTESYPAWEVQVVEPGRYRVTLLYGCAEQNIGGQFRVELNGSQLTGRLETPFDNSQLPVRDRLGRKEVYDHLWGEWTLGEMDVPAGRGKLIVRCLQRPGQEALDLKAVRLERLEP